MPAGRAWDGTPLYARGRDESYLRETRDGYVYTSLQPYRGRPSWAEETPYRPSPDTRQQVGRVDGSIKKSIQDLAGSVSDSAGLRYEPVRPAADGTPLYYRAGAYYIRVGDGFVRTARTPQTGQKSPIADAARAPAGSSGGLDLQLAGYTAAGTRLFTKRGARGYYTRDAHGQYHPTTLEPKSVLGTSVTNAPTGRAADGTPLFGGPGGHYYRWVNDHYERTDLRPE